MTGASKILTVSYGTFSCTLEGFDDPFNTMKAIAEYFRDLAAEDRYFGAEPPTPDAAMLHRIAEREIQRRVEAKINDNGVILRAGDSAGPLAVEAPAQLRPALAEPDVTLTESVAERLQRIRARQNAPEPLAQTSAVAPQDAPDSYIEDEHAEAPAPVAAEPGPIVADASVIDLSDQIDTPVAEPDAVAALVAEDVQPEAGDAAHAALDARLFPEAATDEIVAAEAGTPPAAAEEDLAIEAPETINVIELFDDEALLTRLAAPVAADETPDDVSDEDDLSATAIDEAGLLVRLAVKGAELAEGAPEAQATEAQEETGDWEGAWDEDELNLQEIDFSQPEPAEAMQNAAAETPAIAANLIEEADQLESVAPVAVVTPPPAPRARARVIRIRRAVAVPSDQAETVAPATEPAFDIPATALSDEEEAALQAELAALEAELAAPAADSAPSEQPLAAAPVELVAEIAAPDSALRRPVKTPAEDDAVNRLMAQADSEMSGEETRRRQSAIAHLKAAVAATEADRQATGQTEQGRGSRLDAYRSDLDRVVRPRRPVSDSPTPRPAPAAISGEGGQRPTPLVLVSAQRIDRTEAAPRVVMPVRPRRPASRVAEATAGQAVQMQDFDHSDLEAEEIGEALATENVFADATSFQEFADQLGAQDLPDLLEAAAVYCAEVLQRPEFSRPLVMRQIAAHPSQSDTAREDFLRGFGTLLRQGRIAKVKRGMFALTDRSPYLAEARKLAG